MKKIKEVYDTFRESPGKYLKIAGALLLFFTVFLLGLPQVMSEILGPAFTVLGFTLPYFLEMVVMSLMYIWIPILIYLIVSYTVASKPWRMYAVICINCLFIIFLRFKISHDFSLGDLPTYFFILTQIHVLFLFAFPEATWNFFGACLLFVKGLAVTIMPDAPGNLDDFGMVIAIFGYIFLYLHSLIKLIKYLIEKIPPLQSTRVKKSAR